MHATTDSYKDTVAGLTDANGNGNGSGAGIAAETIIGYQGKMTYDTPDANNVNDTKYNNFTTYVEPSLLRAYRQTNSANSSVLKNFMHTGKGCRLYRRRRRFQCRYGQERDFICQSQSRNFVQDGLCREYRRHRGVQYERPVCMV